MNVDETELVRLVFSPSPAMISVIERVQSDEGTIMPGVTILGAAEAHLTGPAFGITSTAPSLNQAVAGNADTRWTWVIRPTQVGPQDVCVEVQVLLEIACFPVPRTVYQACADLEVKKTWAFRISTFVGGHWQWLWMTVFVSTAGYLWKRKNVRAHEKAVPPTPSRVETPPESA